MPDAATLFTAATLVCLSPDENRLTMIASLDLNDDAADELSADDQLISSWNTIRACAARPLSQGTSAIDVLAADYARLFRGLVRGRWSRPAYEALYLAKNKDEELFYLQGVNDLYRRAGITVHTADRPDFIAVEFDVMREMLTLDARGITGAREIATELYQSHLQKWVPREAEELARAASTPYYQTVAQYLSVIANLAELPRAA